MSRDHAQAGVEQPFDQQRVRAFEGDQHDAELEQSRAHSAWIPRSSWR